MVILDGRFHAPEPKVKRCGCGVRLFQRQGEKAVEFGSRTKCPRCEALRVRCAIDEHPLAIGLDTLNPQAHDEGS
jgi:hypothetical protein